MLVTVFALLWSVLLFAQLVDLAAESVELRAAAGSALPGRGRALTWIAAAAVIAVVAAAIVAALAVDLMADGQLALGVVLIDLLVFAVGAAAIAVVTRMLRPTTGGYPGIRAQIAALSTRRVAKADAADIRRTLASVDADRAERPRTLAWLRFTPALVGLAVVISVVVTLTTAHAWRGWWWLSIADLVMPAASVLIALGTDRVAVLARAAWSTVYSAQRATIETDLDLLERRASRGVTGLTERVSQALRILKEQDARK